MVVGDDVAIGRDDHAAADAVLKLRLRLHLLAVGTEEELPESGRQILRIDAAEALAVILEFLVVLRNARCDGDVDDRRRDARGDGFHRVVERDERRNAVFVQWAGGSGGVRSAVVEDERERKQNRGEDACGDRELFAFATNELVVMGIVHLLQVELLFRVGRPASRHQNADAVGRLECELVVRAGSVSFASPERESPSPHLPERQAESQARDGSVRGR